MTSEAYEVKKLAAYLLERTDGMNWPEARSAETAEIRTLVDEWLRSKGIDPVASRGTFRGEDGSVGSFEIHEANDPPRTWWMARLQEVADNGRRFVASLSITNGSDRVSVYVTLEAGSDESLVGHFDVDPRCPRIVRSLLQLRGRWFHGFTVLRPLQHVSGFEAGELLAAELKHPDRTVPFIVLTDTSRGLPIPSLDEHLSKDLAGIANVVVLDSDATWALTDHLGARLTCFGGAVRLYWPRLEMGHNPYRHPLWTAERLRSARGESTSTSEQFRRQMRTIVMGASALSVVRPSEIDEIRDAPGRREIADLREKARSLQDYFDLVALFEQENQKLRDESASLSRDLGAARDHIAKLAADCAALKAHLKAAKIEPESVSRPEEIDPDPPLYGGPEAQPSDGEVRFYKKRYAARDHDVLIRVSDCGDNKWQGATAADKARKGIKKLEGRDDWKSLQHCGKCEGGGMWRVRW